MKKAILVLWILIFIICNAGCSQMSDDEIITIVKSKYLSGYTSKNIGNAIEDYFNDCNTEWTVTHAEDGDTHNVEVMIQPRNENYIKFDPNDYTDNTMYIKSIYYVFKYDDVDDKIDEYVKVYGTILDNNQLKFFETNSTDESYIFLNRIFGQANTSENEEFPSKLSELNALRKKLQDAKTDEEARQIAGKEDCFPLDLDYLNDNNTSKSEILSALDTVIETEQKITSETKSLYD